jgi:hypothetical protein
LQELLSNMSAWYLAHGNIRNAGPVGPVEVERVIRPAEASGSSGVTNAALMENTGLTAPTVQREVVVQWKQWSSGADGTSGSSGSSGADGTAALMASLWFNELRYRNMVLMETQV